MIILEFSINCQGDWECAQKTDRLIHVINEKYTFHNLEHPAYMFIDLFTAGHIVTSLLPESNTRQGRIEHLSSFLPESHSFNRGTVGGAHITALARFYGYPLLSYTEAAWPAFTRHFVNNDMSNLWNYTADGTHLNGIGAEYLVNKIVIPFFMKEFGHNNNKPLNQPVRRSYYDFDLKMFEDSNYKSSTIAHWSSWGKEKSFMRLMDNMTNHNTNWKFQSIRKHTHGHTCFGTTTSKATLYIDFHIPNTCYSAPEGCFVKVGYVHSWNTSYIGDATFELYEPISMSTTTKSCISKTQEILIENKPRCQYGERIKLFANVHEEFKVKHTTARKSVVTSAIINEGIYTLKIIKSNDTRLICITGFSVIQC